MTLQELYTRIDGNYDHAVQIMRMEKLISRYVLKFPSSDLNGSLMEAAKSMDPTQLFERAHAMKGVCANMGFDKLAEAVGEITEEFRPGNQRKYTDAFLEVHKVHLRKSAFIRTQIFSGSALAELCGIALMLSGPFSGSKRRGRFAQ